MTSARTPLPAPETSPARRARRARERRRRGVRVVSVEITDDVVAAMVAAGALERYDLENPEALAYGIGLYLSQVFEPTDE